ncbi:hypothetical protein CEXT_159441 [Caerostris extrusa]|uniref:Uncharacterized protein n=1 Tax=Caerostris extrusa TaxID=172846 RepID=A0AAV4T453_CAEEX|nr:hypothetical protein CEXT_159441 [Caerostris extrusa]
MSAAKTSSSMSCQEPRKKVAPRCNALNKCDIVSTCDAIHVFHFGAKPSHSKHLSSAFSSMNPEPNELDYPSLTARRVH